MLQQQTGRRWNGLWTMPPAAETFAGHQPIAVFRYPITRFLVEARVYSLTGVPKSLVSTTWHPVDRVAALPMPSPHRRAILEILAKGV